MHSCVLSHFPQARQRIDETGYGVIHGRALIRPRALMPGNEYVTDSCFAESVCCGSPQQSPILSRLRRDLVAVYVVRLAPPRLDSLVMRKGKGTGSIAIHKKPKSLSLIYHSGYGRLKGKRGKLYWTQSVGEFLICIAKTGKKGCSTSRGRTR
jgi:hypothetical protein